LSGRTFLDFGLPFLNFRGRAWMRTHTDPQRLLVARVRGTIGVDR
jgi:hypothetical protein